MLNSIGLTEDPHLLAHLTRSVYRESGFALVANHSTAAQGFGSMPMRSLTADRIRCLQPR